MRNAWISIGPVGRMLILALVLVALCFAPIIAFAAEHCSWDRPGHDPFTGDVPAAVDRYTDIPADVRAVLRDRMERRKYDDLAVIRRDSILGFETRYTDLREMHFGAGKLCRTVSREKWADKHEEVGLIYCEQEHCIIVPTVCRNVSRVTRMVEVELPPTFVRATPEIPPGGDFTFPLDTLPPPSFGHPPPPRAPQPPWYWPPVISRPVSEPGLLLLALVGAVLVGGAVFLSRVAPRDYDTKLDADGGHQ